MNAIDLDFLTSIFKACEKNNVDFCKIEFTIAKLTEWVFSYYKICRPETAKQKVIYFRDNGFLVDVNKGFKFSDKTKNIIELYETGKIKSQTELKKSLQELGVKNV